MPVLNNAPAMAYIYMAYNPPTQQTVKHSDKAIQIHKFTRRSVATIWLYNSGSQPHPVVRGHVPSGPQASPNTYFILSK